MERYRVWVTLPTTAREEWLEFLSETTPLLGEVVEADDYRVRLTGHKSGAAGLYVGKIVDRANIGGD
jgi:hypothetical protein